jgi:hypothetical protein
MSVNFTRVGEHTEYEPGKKSFIPHSKFLVKSLKKHHPIVTAVESVAQSSCDTVSAEIPTTLDLIIGGVGAANILYEEEEEEEVAEETYTACKTATGLRSGDTTKDTSRWCMASQLRASTGSPRRSSLTTTQRSTSAGDPAKCENARSFGFGFGFSAVGSVLLSAHRGDGMSHLASRLSRRNGFAGSLTSAIAPCYYKLATGLYIYGVQRRFKGVQEFIVRAVGVDARAAVLVENGEGGRWPVRVHFLGDGVVGVEPPSRGVFYRGGTRTRAGDAREAVEMVAAITARIQRAHPREEALMEGGAGNRHGQTVQHPPRRRPQGFFETPPVVRHLGGG